MAESTVCDTSRALATGRALLVLAIAACSRSGGKPVPVLEASTPTMRADASPEANTQTEDAGGAKAEVVRVSIGEGGGEIAPGGARIRVLPGAVPA